MEAYHKEQTLFAKQKNQKLTIENQQILAQLEAAEKMKAEHIAFLNSMQQELASKSQVILEMQQHESQLEAQFLGDQTKLQALVRCFITHFRLSY
jgi:DNA-binding MurR/RpiR family transcriptional regulator